MKCAYEEIGTKILSCIDVLNSKYENSNDMSDTDTLKKELYLSILKKIDKLNSLESSMVEEVSDEIDNPPYYYILTTIGISPISFSFESDFLVNLSNLPFVSKYFNTLLGRDDVIGIERVFESIENCDYKIDHTILNK